MNFMELLFLTSSASLFFLILWKWKKVLLMLILMEGFTALLLSLSLSHIGSTFFFLILIFSFFVSEALIILSSVYTSFRLCGRMVGSLIF